MVAESDLLHAEERDGGRLASEVDGALDHSGNAVGGREGHPRHLEIGELQRLAEEAHDVVAQVH
jgi:hypothetical protein